MILCMVCGLVGLVQWITKVEIAPGHINTVKKIEVRMSIFLDVIVSISDHETAKMLFAAEANCSSWNCEWAALLI